jgi:hypothetical protein
MPRASRRRRARVRESGAILGCVNLTMGFVCEEISPRNWTRNTMRARRCSFMARSAGVGSSVDATPHVILLPYTLPSRAGAGDGRRCGHWTSRKFSREGCSISHRDHGPIYLATDSPIVKCGPRVAGKGYERADRRDTAGHPRTMRRFPSALWRPVSEMFLFEWTKEPVAASRELQSV